MKTVIGLAGVKQSGKSTSAGFIKKTIPQVKEVALADKLKNICSLVFNVPRDHFDNQEYKEKPFQHPKIMTYNEIFKILLDFGIDCNVFNPKDSLILRELKSPREIAQIVGTELLRVYGTPDIHCRMLDLSSDITIVSDMRFPNEFKYFYDNKEIKFLPFYIYRKEVESKVTKDSHVSETSVFLFRDQCWWVDNNGTLEDLEETLRLSLACLYGMGCTGK